MTYSAVINWLFKQLPNYQKQGAGAYKPGFNRVNDLLHKLGNPHVGLKTIHIAGTNGKGSVSHILAAIFQAHGYKTGLFTSPHIKDFRERIKINGEWVGEQLVIDFVSNHKVDFERIKPSFFEITTAMAFHAFREAECDIAIVETGLGGRLDSTNVIIDPELTIITNIGIDHIAFLGDSLEGIAIEKAGIIKKGAPVVIGDLNPDLKGVFEKRSKELESPILFSADSNRKTYKTDLLGSFQQRNIHTAMSAIEVIKERWKLNSITTKNALLNIADTTKFKGRLQLISENPMIILDAAHNKLGILNLIDEIGLMKYNRLKIIYGSSNDKEWEEVIANFPITADYYFTEFDSERSVKITDFKKSLKKLKLNAKFFQTVDEALTVSKSEAKKKDLILVCGSFYLMEKIN